MAGKRWGAEVEAQKGLYEHQVGELKKRIKEVEEAEGALKGELAKIKTDEA